MNSVSSTAALPDRAPPSNPPLITIATVVWNGAATLEATILSVAGQTFRDFEYVVIDGGSTDGTLDIVSRYRDQVTTLVSEKDRGIYDAMNKALLQAKGRWLLFLGADDTLAEPDTLAKVARHLLDPTRVYYGDVTLNSSGQRYCGPMSSYKLMQQNICHQCIFYPAQVYRQKKYDLEVGLLADYKYNIELWGGPHAFQYMEVVVARFEDKGASSKPDRKFERQRLPLIRHQLGWQWALVKQCRTLMVRLRNLLR